MSLDRLLGPEIVSVTEKAAIAAAQTMGRGDANLTYQVAAEAMRASLDELRISGRIAIGEDEGDRGDVIRLGEDEHVGALDEADSDTPIDLAVDPLEGVDLCATGTPGAVSVIAAAERGGLLSVPHAYMEKIIVGPTSGGRLHLEAPVPENLRNIAAAFGREVSDLTVVVLDRPRHGQLVADIRAAGARIRLIRDGDLSAGIAAAVRGTGVHAVMGIGGAREGVLTAAALRCLGGEIQARLVALDGVQHERLAEHGFTDLDRIYTIEELAPGDKVLMSATGVTDGEFLRGVRFFGGGARTSTLLLSLVGRTVRFIDSIHREDMRSPVLFR